MSLTASDWVRGNILDGKRLASLIRASLKEKVSKLPDTQLRPGLAVILAGEDPASEVYVAHKSKDAQEVGFHSVIRRISQNEPPETILNQIQEWNADPGIHGILVQLPLPVTHSSHTGHILQEISAYKDADGFHYENLGRLFAGKPEVIPCTPFGIACMLSQLPVELTGKKMVVLGRSNIVGKPMAALGLMMDMTVTICHSRTLNLEEELRGATVVVSATGQRNVFPESWIPESAIVVDVGIHRLGNSLTGDLDLSRLARKSPYYTPVPGGVGPMTRAMLLYNTWKNYMRLNSYV